jgi:two-component system sensor histidine kinase KdpD
MDKKEIITKKIAPSFISGINHYILSIFTIGLTTIVCTPLSNQQGYHIVSFILLFVVSILATFMRIGPVFLAATLSALVWNFFFIPPNLTFHIDKTEDILMFGMFFIIALVNGVLTTKVRRQEQLAREREKRTNALFQLTRELSRSSGINEVLAVAGEGINNHFQTDPVFILQDGNNSLHSSGRLQKERKLTPNEYGVAEWVFTHLQKAGKFTETLSHADYTFYPLSGARINAGVVAVKLDQLFSGDQKAFWDTFLTQISNALEREFLGELAQKARFLVESDRLYKTLFNSISHELRIPVATIMGASDSLLNSPLPVNVQSALFNEIFTASLRLNRLIENLLNMSRLESGQISVRLDWYDMNDLVNKVAEDLKDELKPFSLVVSIPDDMPLVKIDYGLLEQVLYNLIFNSTQYAPVASIIELYTHFDDGVLLIAVKDLGPGFPEEAIENVFKKFFRVDGSKTGGLGLGLSIVKGFVEAHKGTVTVENRKNGGSEFTIRIPTENPEIHTIQPDNE